MTGGWKVEENQNQVSLHSPPALEIAGAIPTFPPPRTRFYSRKGEPKAEGPTTLSSGSFFDENMLPVNGSSKTLAKNGGTSGQTNPAAQRMEQQPTASDSYPRSYLRPCLHLLLSQKHLY
jgi:hypothetical protein